MLVNIMHRKTLIVTLILASVGLSACGYKAPVYYPSAAQRQELKEKEARIKARKEARKAQQQAEKAKEAGKAKQDAVKNTSDKRSVR